MTKAQNKTLCSQHVLHIDGNLLVLAFFSNSLNWKKNTLNLANEILGGNQSCWNTGTCLICSHDRLYSFYFYCLFFFSIFFKYLAIPKSYFNIIFQCYKCIVISADNQQQSESSGENSSKLEVFMISKKSHISGRN